MVDMDITLIDCPLDPDERAAFIANKRDSCIKGYSDVAFKDPTEGLLSEIPSLRGRVKPIPVEPWLLPTPPGDMLFMLTVQNFITFMDSNGCREYANKVRDSVASSLPNIPLVVGVDHSLSGGAIEALAMEHGGENIRLIVLDSHFDYILPTVRCGLIQYDMETNPKSNLNSSDPYLFNRPDSYNADSFLFFLRKTIPPENTYIVGVSDYPPRKATESSDPRVKKYVESYKSVQDEGVHVIRKEDLKTRGDYVKELLSMTDKPYTYVSIDVDVCANTGLKGARFLEYNGLSAADFSGLIGEITASLRGSKLAGLDFMEFNVYKAGAIISGRKDRTYEIMAEAARRLTGILR